MIHTQPVVLCGGSGTRLWPLSRAGFPKQFLSLGGTQSLFQLAFQRLNALQSPDILIRPSLIVTNEQHRFLALEQLREINAKQASLILEPCARNTAAALTAAALRAVSLGGDPVLVASPADQHIGVELSYTSSLRKAIAVAAGGKIVILGIPPNRPEIGYGYIRSAPCLEDLRTSDVLSFVEKPNADIAEAFIASGEYAWNSGMFVLKASVWLKAIGAFRPDILEACAKSCADLALDAMQGGLTFIRPNAELFHQIPSESVDRAVMENCPGSEFQIRMVALNAAWSDVGAWDAVWNTAPADSEGNVVRGDVLLDSSRGNYVHATSRLVSVVGVTDLAIVETADAVLVCQKSSSQNVKNIVAKLQKSGRDETNLHRKVHRPWGWYDSVDQGERFKVKRINVKPGASLSLQKHAHRAEHWVVVKGKAQVTCGDRVEVLSENQSTYIPVGVTHRLSNLGSTDVEIIEVQTGQLISESDIVRLDDQYGRN
jgi:mannose-1-phosphate guanylyltransferase / mannose-6-phosphate isomerase